MTLRGRTFLSVGAVLALLFAALYAGTSALLADAYSRTEQVLLAESLDRALGALDANLGSLMETARDWDHRRAAPGDQTGTESRDPESESSVRHYETLDVDFMLRVTPSDAVSFADGPKGDLARGATDLRRALPELRRSLAKRAKRDKMSVGGLTTIGGVPAMIAAAPEPDNSRAGTVPGFLVMGRLLSEDRTKQIARTAQLQMTLLPPTQSARAKTAQKADEGWTATDASTARASRMLRGLGDKPVGVVRVSLPSSLHPRAGHGQRYLVIGLIVTALGTVGALFILLDRQILARVQSFSRAVRRIRELPDDQRRLPTAGRDELDELATTINSMLDSVNESNERLQHDAFHDPLTALANRTLFLNRLEKARNAMERQPLEHFAVLLVDLDDFKRTNDDLGHAAGDHLLAVLAERMEACVRAADTVARMGGDEFGILLSPVADGTDATRLAERLLDELKQPVSWCGQEILSTASLGISLCMSPETQGQTLLREADIAMYRAKRQGKNQCKLFDEQMAVQVTARLQLEAQLLRAIDRGEFRVYYQPIVDLSSGSACGLEALVRWHHPERGLLIPAHFLAAAEDAGLIGDLDRWVVARACQFLAELRSRGDGPLPMGVCVNLSSRHLPIEGLDEHVIESLASNGLSPDALHLEVTENAVLDHSNAFGKMLLNLRSRGIRLSLDDFGAGVTSVNHLQGAPVHMLKLDCSFVQRLDEGQEGVVRAVVELAHALEMEVVAEGVEHAQQLRSLKAMGCEFGQGRLFSEPLPPSRVVGVLEHRGLWRDLVSGTR